MKMNKGFTYGVSVLGVFNTLVSCNASCENSEVLRENNLDVKNNDKQVPAEDKSLRLIDLVFGPRSFSPALYCIVGILGLHKGYIKLFEPNKEGSYSFLQIVFYIFSLWKGYRALREAYRFVFGKKPGVSFIDGIGDIWAYFDPLVLFVRLIVNKSKEKGNTGGGYVYATSSGMRGLGFDAAYTGN